MQRKLIALTTILLVVFSIFTTLVLSGVSVVYRMELPTEGFLNPKSNTLFDLCYIGVNEHKTSDANSLNITSYDQFPITLQYNNAKYDFITWNYEDLSKVPANTIVYIYFYISQIAVGEEGKAVIFSHVKRVDTNAYCLHVLCDSEKIWIVKSEVSKDKVIQSEWTDAEGYTAVTDQVSFNPSSQLIISLKIKFLDDCTKEYVDTIYIIQNNQIILQYYYNKTFDSGTLNYGSCVVVAKYQLTVSDMYVSYDAPDALLSEGEESTPGVPKWLNFTVNPPSYTIKYYNYTTKEVIKVGTGSLNEQYPYNSTILVKVFTDEGTKKFESKYVMTRDYDIYLDFEYEREKYNLTVKVYDEQLRELVADYIYVDSKSWRSVQKVSTLVTEGSHRIRVKRSGYKEFDNVVQVNSNVTYCVTLVPESSTYSSDISKDTPVNATTPEEYYTNKTIYNPPTEIQKDFYGFIFRNERSTDVTVVIYGTKTTVMGGWYKVPIAETTISANSNKTLVLYVEDVNAYMNYKLGEFGQCFIIEDKATGKVLVEADMNAFKNQYRIIVIREDTGLLIGGKGATGGTAMFGTTLGILYMLLPIMIILSLVSALTKMIKKSTR